MIRRTEDADWHAVVDVHRRAFVDDPTVPSLIEELRSGGHLVSSLAFVAVADDHVVGNVLSSWVGLEDSDRRFLQLSPLGVLPQYQRRGLGGELVRGTLDGARSLGEPLVFVEGNPRYYGRFGFVRADELGWLPPPEALYDWAFQVAVLDERAELPHGRVVYPEPFRH